MKNFLTFLLISFSFFSFAQNYWQQEVNYTIAVKLDDKNHILSGEESFEYINNSPDTLGFIYVHLWPNAYLSGSTPLGKQLYENGEDLLTFGNDSLKGGIDSLRFRINGQAVLQMYESEEHDEYVKLILNQSLLPGGKITVSTPFRVKIPSGEISRLGHVGQSYQITQWYPKPAVYDKNGWNQMPYLNQGEFYSEYGSYDVSITLPANYVVGATGDLQTQSEIDFLNKKAADSSTVYFDKKRSVSLNDNSFPASSRDWKTIRYKQSKVHDFAWFADKRYVVLKGEVELPQSKRKVTSWAMFTPKNAWLWKQSTEYINDAVFYYSKWNGDYPYNQVTAVDGTISAGGGMEYPNVTVIGDCSSAMELEVVIVHEVGHNWFYGILGSNERVHGWMDEGVNTLNEMRYMYTKYPDNDQLSKMILDGKFHFDGLSHYDSGDFSYRLIAGIGEDQPIETPSAVFTPVNYGVIMYQKTGLVFSYLKQYLGDELFDKCMHAYFEEWKFKHPQPEDMKRTLERESGKDLSWLFGDLIKTTKHIDYRLAKVRRRQGRTTAYIRNRGQINSPVEIGVYKNGKLEETRWILPGGKTSAVEFSSEADEVRLNPSGKMPELNQQNNYWRKKGLFGKFEKPKLEFLIGDVEPARTNLFWTPVIAANAHDGFMLGAAVHNMGIPQKPFQFLVAPLYGFGSKRLSGIAEISYTFLPARNLKLSRFGISCKSFSQGEVMDTGFDSKYAALMPYWFANIGNRKAASPWSQTILLQGMLRNDANAIRTEEITGAYLKYNLSYSVRDHKAGLEARADEIRSSLIQLGRISGEATYSYRYLKDKKERWLELRGYLGYNYRFLTTPVGYPRGFLSLSGASGTQDLFLEDYFLGRGESRGLLSQQRLDNMGGFRSTSTIGNGSGWLASGNFYMQLPVGPKAFGVYADLGLFRNPATGKVETAWNAGLGFRLGKVAALYFPLIESQNIIDSYSSLNYTNRIRLTLRLNPVNKGLKLTELF